MNYSYQSTGSGEYLRRVRRRLDANVMRSSSRAPRIRLLPAKPSGKSTNSRPSRGIPIAGRHSSRRINRASIGKSGSPPCRRRLDTRGRCILSGNFCITIPKRSRFSPIIRSRMRRRITFARDFIVIDLRQLATPPGGSGSRSVNGCRALRRQAAVSQLA